MTHKNFYENIESRCWTEMDDWWSLGGCPPPTDETGKSKLQEEEFENCIEFHDCVKIVEFDMFFDNSVLSRDQRQRHLHGRELAA